MADGHLNKCKECTVKDSNTRYDVKKNDPAWMESERERGRKKYEKYQYRSSHADNPDKRKAKGLTSHVRGKDGNEYHHWSYAIENAKDTILIPRTVHRHLHKRLEYLEDLKCYKVKETNQVLDTKEKHIDYLITNYGESIL